MQTKNPCRSVALAATAILLLLASSRALAQGFPFIDFDSQGMTAYEAATGEVTMTASTLFVTPGPGTPPSFVFPGSEGRETVALFAIDAAGELDPTGANTLSVTGRVVLDGIEFDGLLLDVAIDRVRFSAEPGETNFTYVLSGDVLGGLLADRFDTDRVSVPVQAEDGDFMGFDRDFTGGAKGQVINASGLLGACCLPDSGCEELSDLECARRGGDFRGEDTTCESIDEYSHVSIDPPGQTEAGDVREIVSVFNASTKRFTYNVTLDPVDGMLANGFTTIVNDGPMPREGSTGEYAIFYLDATREGDTRLSVYTYNGGADDATRIRSFEDGDGDGAADGGDLIACSLIDPSFVIDLMDVDNPDGSRTLGFTIDATDIIDHDPRFPTAGADFFGVGFADLIGYWTHPTVVETTYDRDNCLTSWNRLKRSWADRENLPAQFLGCIERDPVATLECLTEWAFNEQAGQDVYDLMGNIDLQIDEDRGSVRWIDDHRFGTGLEFMQDVADGQTMAITESRSTARGLKDILNVDDEMTFETLFRIDDAHASGGRIFSWSDGTDVQDRNLSVLADPVGDRFELEIRLRTTDSGVRRLHLEDRLIDAGQTIHLALTYDIDTGTLLAYVDGRIAGSLSGFEGGFAGWEDYKIMLGNESQGERPFDGVIYEVRIYEGTATSGQVAAMAADLLNRCRADLDGDGELTLFDFLEYQNLFDAGSPAADFDGDGQLNIFDFLAFQNDFATACG
ncbi:MAG: LamG-like jellyroll fold domain-containing protein [Phycisphaerales bacterium]|jgi:hypothetical protein